MPKVITHEGFSYEITGPVIQNEDDTIFECPGFRSNQNNNDKEAITILFIKRTIVSQSIGHSNGTIKAICQLPSSYSDDRLHQEYNISNSDFWLCIKERDEHIPKKDPEESQKSRKSKDAKDDKVTKKRKEPKKPKKTKKRDERNRTKLQLILLILSLVAAVIGIVMIILGSSDKWPPESSDNLSSDEGGTDGSSLDEGVSDDSGSDEGVSEGTGSDEGVSEGMGSDEGVSEGMGSDEGSSDDSDSNGGDESEYNPYLYLKGSCLIANTSLLGASPSTIKNKLGDDFDLRGLSDDASEYSVTLDSSNTKLELTFQSVNGKNSLTNIRYFNYSEDGLPDYSNSLKSEGFSKYFEDSSQLWLNKNASVSYILSEKVMTDGTYIVQTYSLQMEPVSMEMEGVIHTSGRQITTFSDNYILGRGGKDVVKSNIDQDIDGEYLQVTGYCHAWGIDWYKLEEFGGGNLGWVDTDYISFED